MEAHFHHASRTKGLEGAGQGNGSQSKLPRGASRVKAMPTPC